MPCLWLAGELRERLLRLLLYLTSPAPRGVWVDGPGIEPDAALLPRALPQRTSTPPKRIRPGKSGPISY